MKRHLIADLLWAVLRGAESMADVADLHNGRHVDIQNGSWRYPSARLHGRPERLRRDSERYILELVKPGLRHCKGVVNCR